MFTRDRFTSTLAVLWLIVLPACRGGGLEPDRPLSPGGPASSRVPVQVPMGEQFVDLNPCTGNLTTYTFSGTARVQAFADHYLLVASGTVHTDDGFSGSFNRQFVYQGDQVTHLRFHDSEIADAGGQRIMFGVGLFHETSPNGDPVVSFEQFSGLRCVGRGA
jgi:hypothetical protein